MKINNSPISSELKKIKKNTKLCTSTDKRYRFHSAQHFESAPERFYLNFIESYRTWSAQYRFAPRGSFSGFFFSNTVDGAIAEICYYDSDRKELPTENESLSVWDDKILLSCDIEHSGLCDFTFGPTLYQILSRGSLQIDFHHDIDHISLFRFLLSAASGGNSYTDALGMDAQEAGFSGVRFPSVRLLNSERDSFGEHGINYSIRDIFGKCIRGQSYYAI
ncbi:hypothetical protein AB833_25770 [Chromatiales bacterium (ex Bugula neritina AB1)]|nr:hypothetical protein AB833_25770 [Chromatiales bacterium (ex Bugula neritina AB1)]